MFEGRSWRKKIAQICQKTLTIQESSEHACPVPFSLEHYEWYTMPCEVVMLLFPSLVARLKQNVLAIYHFGAQVV